MDVLFAGDPRTGRRSGNNSWALHVVSFLTLLCAVAASFMSIQS